MLVFRSGTLALGAVGLGSLVSGLGLCLSLRWGVVGAIRGLAARAGGRTMVSGVPARPLKDNSRRYEHFAELFLPTLRTAGQRLITEFLLALETNAATFAQIRINWHTTPRNCRGFELLWARSNYSLSVSGWQGPGALEFC